MKRLLKDMRQQNKRGNPEGERHENQKTWTSIRERHKGTSDLMVEPKKGSCTGGHAEQREWMPDSKWKVLNIYAFSSE